MAKVKERSVGGRESAGRPSSSLGGYAVGQADRASRAAVVAGPEQTGLQSELGLDGRRRSQTELGEVERGIVLGRPGQPDEMIDNLRRAKGGQDRGLDLSQKSRDLRGSRLAPEQGDHGV